MKTKYSIFLFLWGVFAAFLLTAPPGVVAAPGPAPAVTPNPKESPMTSLIPREVLFGNPDVQQVLISPDGKWISYLAPRDGVLNVWVAPVTQLDKAKPLTQDKKRGIRNHYWTFDSRYLLYGQDTAGDENWHIHLVPVGGGEDKDLTPFPKTQAWVVDMSPDHPGRALVALNNRDARYHDLYLMDLPGGKLTEVLQNDQEFMDFSGDFDLKVRLASKYDGQGNILYFAADGAGGFKKFMEVPAEDTLTSHPCGFLKSGDAFYFENSQGRDKGALYRYDLRTGKRKLLASDKRCDVGRVLRNPLTGELEAVAYYYQRQDWQAVGSAVKKDLAFFKKNLEGDFEILSRTKDDRFWTVIEWKDNGTDQFYLYDRGAQKLKFLMAARKGLVGQTLARMRPETITTRDGLKMVCYLSLPATVTGDKPNKPMPMVLFVHGGPWARDYWGYSAMHQFLANRGYAVLSVNYRGSTGFGKSFINAGNLEWGRKMQNDLVDAVKWAIRERIADPDRVAIMGGSYGGYATLAGLAFDPDMFICGVDIVGPSNLNTLLATIPPYWTPGLQLFYKRMGDPRTAEGKKLLDDRSPLNHADQIKKPLLIGQGANDPRVKQAESDQIVKALKSKSIPVAYVLFSDEGHGFARPENNQAFMAVTEAFLKKYLGGEAEPVGKAFQGSTIQILEGKDRIPGLP
jgi:dipeptidyl aminopeptidase/acylaminoacyl peptidase